MCVCECHLIINLCSVLRNEVGVIFSRDMTSRFYLLGALVNCFSPISFRSSTLVAPPSTSHTPTPHLWEAHAAFSESDLYFKKV